MNCHRVQSLLSAYLDQELSSEERRLIRNHLFNCPVCAQCFEELSRIKIFLGSLEPPRPQSNLIDDFFHYKLRVEDFIETNPWVWGKRLALTAACIFLFLLTSFYMFPVNSTNHRIASQEVKYQTYEPFTPYQLVNEQSSYGQFFLEEDKAEEERKKRQKLEEFYLPPHQTPLPGIPVSYR
ncbi:MAG TPA: zf-HC2 domain-containing protein [Firmicutes bacterium]|uniref:Anti-sigma-W factor RsiW n=1 Tax=Capillibacterium thermochitinicola TaxID=2699427 RepID=A0A8J6LJ13_9FIRM|nr:zf-HC2 domain-containing protein [Capillibacterium thermochitinicola]MBA2133550.1 zf-HC2 domain-containing protein [Capillibacterium thermochitinicola]HHW12338.1 zf-HC2 domain-containing protein [Bacillota bacterium]